MEAVIGHIHVPKCGGTSVSKLLDEALGAAHLRLWVDDTYFVYSEEALANLITPSVQVFSSHYLRTFPGTLAGRKARYFTFLRHPVEQFISYLTYSRRFYHVTRD